MTRHDAIREETRRYLTACSRAADAVRQPAASVRALRKAHIHALALGRLRGQSLAPWIHHFEVTS